MESYELLVCFEYEPPIGQAACKHFLPFHRLSMGRLFILWIVSLAVQKLLVGCHPTCLFLVACAFAVEHKNASARPVSGSSWPVFSSRSSQIQVLHSSVQSILN